MEQKLKQFAEIVGERRKQQIIRLCGSLRGNEQGWIPSIKPGRKYTKVDIGTSGKYMVENETQKIYGIKAYGVIHRGHYFGTLDEFIAKHRKTTETKQIEPEDKEEYRLVLTVRQVVNGEQNLVCYDGLCGIYDTLKEAIEAAKCLKPQLA